MALVGGTSCGLTAQADGGQGGSAGDAATAGSGAADGSETNACGGDRAIETAEQFASFAAEKCRSLSGTLTLRGVDSVGQPTDLRLTSLSGLEQLESARVLDIHHQAALVSLEGLTRLRRLEQLSLWNNSHLASLRGLERLEMVNGSVALHANPALVSCQGLDALERVGALEIWHNAALLSLRGLESLQRVSGRLALRANSSLNSLSGLENVQDVGAELEIAAHAALRTLEPLHGWPARTARSTLFIHDNAELPRCESEHFDVAQTRPNATCNVAGVDQCTGNAGTTACEAHDAERALAGFRGPS